MANQPSAVQQRGQLTPRPLGVTLLSLFSIVAMVIAFTSAVSLLSSGGVLEPMWQINPRARVAFASLGVWAIVLLFTLSLVCATAAIGLWRGTRWGYLLALA